jgi:hypothetical protein
MRLRRRPERVLEEGESYYVSMTDMMVGVLFIFIIMLSFFALQYRATTATLTKAKDSETSALLTVATALQAQPVLAEIDHAHHVVCIPAAELVSGDDGKRCFAYSNDALKPPPDVQAGRTRAAVVSFVNADLTAAKVRSSADSSSGTISFPAEQLFIAGTATLSPNGQDIARKVAASLAQRMPCYGYGAPATRCSGQKMTVVNVLGQAGFDAFSDAGRQAAALSLQRSVAFHQALTAAAPVLGQLTNAPSGGQPLLRVATYGQSDAKADPAGAGQTITVQFVPAS